ncbi:MAG TPA: tetratricopeptide repeat protein [Anaerolineae bacterium]|nr:tetratricopeptide repeat protein [Anaerolineae bacterium]
MDRIVTAIVAALANQNLGSDTLANPRTAAIYQTLKTTLAQKYGPQSDLVEALQFLEKKPKSSGRRAALHEEIAAVHAEQESDLLTLAADLLASVKPRPLQAETRYLTPLQRPPQADYFVGRVMDLEKLIDLVQPGQTVSLTGLAGLGKSALVASALWSMAPHDIPPERFPDGIIYHNFFSQPRLDVALEALVKAFGQEPLPTLEQAVARLVAERQALLVFDGVEAAVDGAGGLGLPGRCGWLLVGQQAAEGGTSEYTLSALTAQDSLLLLQALSEGRNEEPAAALKICELLGGVPLSLRLAGHIMAAEKESAANFLTWLETTPLAQAELEERAQMGVNVLLTQVFSRLSYSARQALSLVRLLALAPFDQKTINQVLLAKESPGVFSALKGILKPGSLEPDEPDNSAWRELNRYGWLWWIDRQYEISHPLIHAFIRQHLPVEPILLQRLASHYMTLVSSLTSLGPQRISELEAARPHFMTVLNECLAQKNWEAAHSLAAVVESYLDQQGSFIERIIVNEAGLTAAWHLGRLSEGAWFNNLGDTYRTAEQPERAIQYFTEALETARKNDDAFGEANSLGNLGLAYRDLGKIDQAKIHLQESQALFGRLGSPRADLVRDWLMELDAAGE